MKRQIRIDIAPDVYERLDPICRKLDISPTWLVNHLLRSIQRVEINSTIEVKPESRIPVRRLSTWQVKL